MLQILTYPNPALKEPASKVINFDAELSALMDNLKQTMYAANGIGLASTQVGVMKRAAVVDVSENGDKALEFINPEIIWRDQNLVQSEEGCLSIPDYRDIIERHAAIKVTAQDRSGQSFDLEAEGILAICLQHEIDHLDGILFIDRLSRLKRDVFKRWLKKRTRLEKQL